MERFPEAGILQDTLRNTLGLIPVRRSRTRGLATPTRWTSLGKQKVILDIDTGEDLNLVHLTDEKAGALAYGQQRRLEIARALATHPKLLLLDEPAAGMNPQETRELAKLVQDLRSRYALTIFLIEHDMKFVMGLCERIKVLDYGVTIAEGTPAEIQKNPEVIKAYLGEPKHA